ncbi:MAG: transporter ATP-binding protein [Deltaproteobacteria bacterium]|jgi:branched-chain amino acid transport system ATP-binding protein|nr:transporter ATP-binding protein [Deltaproteobacteria bacterium]
MLLDVRNIRVHYDKVEAVKGVSLGAEAGMISTLIGANGAGKTTILKAISGLKRLTAGEIRFGGQRIDGMSAHKIVELGIAHVPEGRRLFGLMTVRHNLLVGAYLQKDKKELERVLEEVFHHFPILKERQSQIAKTLSGGEQQMLAMGRALMAKPKVILMDEPSLGLAPLMVVEITRIIDDIKNGGLTVLLVEQNASLALGLADTGYVLETGRMALQGESRELVKNEHVRKAYLGG